ncbi:MAG TPA: cytochrome c oxidase subunit II [Pseudomonadales bacterium]|nr:cytochrome c oxidase subunit II [Pseudomonadales bacterium]
MQSVRKLCALTVSACLAIAAQPAIAAWQLDLTEGVTQVSRDVYALHRIMLWICVVIAIIVFGAMFYSILQHRKSKGVKPAHFHENTAIEILWTVIPFLVLIAMAVPATRTLLSMADSGNADLTIRVTGSQWKWHYEYLDYKGDNSLKLGYLSMLSTPSSQYDNHNGPAFPGKEKALEGKGEHYLLEVDKPLVIPTGEKVRFLITSDDVIHAWYVPAFSIKRDAVPGFVNEQWTRVDKEGIYRGQCAELCGKDHGFMPIVVEAKNPEDFKRWLANAQAQQKADEEAAANSVDKTFSKAELMAEGEKVYNARCAACHQANGSGLPPMFPALKGSLIANNKERLADHISIVLNGKNAMPAWKSQLKPKELAAVITFERNSWGNDTGDVVQPKDVVK